MSLSRNTLMILKSFAKINPGIAFRPGNRLSTISPFKNVYAKAFIPEEIPFEFGIKDLDDFCKNCFNLMEDDKAISIYEGQTTIEIKKPEGFYRYFSHEIDKIFSRGNIENMKGLKEKLKSEYAKVLGQEVMEHETPKEVEYAVIATSIILDKIDTFTQNRLTYNTCKASLILSPKDRFEFPESEDNGKFILEKAVLRKSNILTLI